MKMKITKISKKQAKRMYGRSYGAYDGEYKECEKKTIEAWEENGFIKQKKGECKCQDHTNK